MASAPADDPPPRVRMSAVTLGIPFFTHLLGLGATWACLKQLQILWICDEVLGPEPGANSTLPGSNATLAAGGHPIFPYDRCDAPEVQATASAWFTVLSLCYNVPSLVLVPLFGYFIDRWSRKNIILLAMAFSVVHTVSMIVITNYHYKLVEAGALLTALAVTSFVHGAGGGRHVIIMSIFALVADVTTKAERTTYIARFESIILGAFTFGPLIGGIMVKVFGSNIPPLYFSVALDVFTISWVFFVVPETVRQTNRSGSPLEPKDYDRLPDTDVPEENVAVLASHGIVDEVYSDGSPVRSAQEQPAASANEAAAQPSIPRPRPSRTSSWRDPEFYRPVVKSVFAPKNRNRTLLVLILLLLNFVSGGTSFFFVLYTRAHFGWKAFEDGIYSFVSSAAKITSLSFVLPVVLARLKTAGVSGHEIWAVRFGLFMYVIALYLYGATTFGWSYLLITAFIDSFGSALAGPTMRSLVSTSTHATQQGRVLSVVAFVEAVAALISPLIYGPLYAGLVKAGRESWAFYVCSILCFCAFSVSWAMSTADSPVQLPAGDEEIGGDRRENSAPGSEEAPLLDETASWEPAASDDEDLLAMGRSADERSFAGGAPEGKGGDRALEPDVRVHSD
ncbi:major facilitator superfamily domain-containing protein [Hyaloraphidium curvatum]|nr:major facilitator superfamily domain-containing protein [Hyaloraphidium curvatum]